MTSIDLIGVHAVGLVALFTVAFLLGALVRDSFWKTECIERRFAHYNETTGDWEWIEEGKDSAMLEDQR